MGNVLQFILGLPLTFDVKKRIIEETKKDKGDGYLSEERDEIFMKNLAFCILFVWNKTPEGFVYWVDINNQIYGN